MFELVLDDADIAVELYLAFQEGEITFYEAVNQYSGDPDLRRSGGYRGHVSRSSLKPEISSAVFAATPPQVLKPIVTSKGVHLILIEEFIQPQLDDRLYQEILTNLFSNWMRKKIQTVKVEIEL
jgi:parvulin-like peptidyl-prolyl isomerase